MECLPSFCEKSLSKNCASLLNIESLRRESTGLLSPPQVRWWGYVGSQPSIPSTPRDSGTRLGHLSSLEPQSPRVCSCLAPQKVAGSVHMSSYTWEKKKFHTQMAEMKLDAICIWFRIFLNKESKKGNRETLWSCHSILRLLFHCFLKKKHRSGSKEGITPNTGKHLKMLVIEYKESKWPRLWRHQQEEGLGWGKEAVCGLGCHEDKLADGWEVVCVPVQAPWERPPCGGRCWNTALVGSIVSLQRTCPSPKPK